MRVFIFSIYAVYTRDWVFSTIMILLFVFNAGLQINAKVWSEKTQTFNFTMFQIFSIFIPGKPPDLKEELHLKLNLSMLCALFLKISTQFWNTRNTWPTKIWMSFFSFSDNLLQDAY